MVMGDIGLIMAAMAMVAMVAMAMMIILRSYISKEKIIHKRLQEHRLTIGIIAVIRKAIIHMSRSVQMAGYRSLPTSHQLHQLHQPYNKDSSC